MAAIVRDLPGRHGSVGALSHVVRVVGEWRLLEEIGGHEAMLAADLAIVESVLVHGAVDHDDVARPE